MCGTEVVDEARFCPHCGVALPGAKPKAAALHGGVKIEQKPESSAPAADPFSHTVPADPKELDRIREMIQARSQQAVPVRERKLGSTKAIEAVEAAQTQSPQGARAGLRDQTLESQAVREIDVKGEVVDRITPPPAQPAHVAAAAPSPAAMRSPVSPRAETTATAAPRVGGAVRVLWSDGRSYDAMIVQLSPGHALVRFTNGQTQWMELRFLTPR